MAYSMTMNARIVQDTRTKCAVSYICVIINFTVPDPANSAGVYHRSHPSHFCQRLWPASFPANSHSSRRPGQNKGDGA